MAEILMFPTKKHLPQEVEDCIYEIADAYVKTLNYALSELSSDNPSNAELEEIKDQVVLCYGKALLKAIDKMEEES